MVQNVLANSNTDSFGSNLCIKCKGRGFCRKPKCVYLEKMKSVEPIVKKIGKEFFGASPPSVFVGRVGYPNVFAGTLAPMGEGDTSKYDAPRLWHKGNWDIEKVLSHRMALVNSRTKTNVKKTPNTLDALKEIAMSKKSVDIEAHYSKPIHTSIRFGGITAPSGPCATIETLKLTENPNTSRKIEYVVSGTDFKANDAIQYLYRKKTDEGDIMKLLSIGILGEKTQRKLVPTRWAITAVDDSLGKNIAEKIKQYPIINSPIFFCSQYLGNFFNILLLPRAWSYELIEMWHPQSVWTAGDNISIGVDFENYFGRKTYASNTHGAYYAARLSVLEYLEKIKKQASVLIVREIVPDYWAPLGVWVIREAVRDAFTRKAADLENKNAINIIEYKLVCKKSEWQNKSNILNNILKQKRIGDF